MSVHPQFIWSVHCHNDLAWLANSWLRVRDWRRARQRQINNGLGECAGNCSLRKRGDGGQYRPARTTWSDGIDTATSCRQPKGGARPLAVVAHHTWRALTPSHTPGIHQDGVPGRTRTQTAARRGCVLTNDVLGVWRGRNAFCQRSAGAGRELEARAISMPPTRVQGELA